MLDFDLTYLGLAFNKLQRIGRYKRYIQKGASDTEVALLRNAWSPNQLTGNACFVDEIDKRAGYRIENRGRGTPRRKSLKLFKWICPLCPTRKEPELGVG